MASKKASMDNLPARSGGSLAGALLSIIAAGVAGGALLISGAKALGEFIEAEGGRSSRRLEERREADKEEVRRITANEPEEY